MDNTNKQTKVCHIINEKKQHMTDDQAKKQEKNTAIQWYIDFCDCLTVLTQYEWKIDDMHTVPYTDWYHDCIIVWCFDCTTVNFILWMYYP